MEPVFVSSKDLIVIDNFEELELPHLKHIELPNQTPEQFGLAKWERPFTIPNCYMRRLYKDDFYFDTDLAPKPKPEQIKPEQKKLLHDYLKSRRHYDEETMKERRSKSNLPIDTLAEELSMFDTGCPNKHSTTRKQLANPIEGQAIDKIAVCMRHRVQTADNIALKAVEKMKYLTHDQEAEFKRLIGDKEFMSFLDNQIGSYMERLDKCKD